MWHDLRYAARTLVSNRLFSGVVVICLALSIATNTTMFSVFDAIFWRPLPFAQPDQLVSIAGRHPETGRRAVLSLDDVRDLAASSQSLTALAAYSGRTLTLTDDGAPERIPAQLVTPNLFPTLGVALHRGRDFEAADNLVSAAPVAIIGEALWRRRYQGDASVIGRSIRLDNRSHTIIGVMPRGFSFPNRSELWIAMAPALGTAAAASRGVSVIGRLRADVTLDRANAELGSRVLPAAGTRTARSGTARPIRSAGVGNEERTITGALMGTTSLLLLIACANVANLLLARGAGRRREMALRAALGASRARIMRQLVFESLLLAVFAAILALPLAWYGIAWVRDAVPPTDPMVPSYMQWTMDARTVVWAFGIAVVVGLAFGLAPAFDATGRRLQTPLREGSGAATSRVQRRTHDALIVAQIALAVILLATASLFVRSYAGVHSVLLGYDPARLMTARVFLAGSQYDDPAARERAIDDINARLGTPPGADAATISDLVPLDDQGGTDAPAAIEGRVFAEETAPVVHYAGVAGRWPETLGLRLLAGRTFLDSELQSRLPVALVNEVLGRTFWPGENPIGRRFRIADGDDTPWLSVIGVVPNIRTVKLDETRATPPTAYLPHRFVSTRNYGIIVRTSSRPESVVPAIRDAVRSVDPTVALFDVYTMTEVRWLSYWMYVLWGTLFAVIGAIALVVASVGVYGVVFFTVAQRTREIGIRAALGATRMQVVFPMLKQAAILTALGIAIGLLGAWLVTPLVGSLLIGVSPNDPVSFAVVSLTLALVAVLGTWIPAWRASDVHPVVALREP